MNQRIWAVVAAFAGVAILIGLWMSMQTSTTPVAPGPRVPKPLTEARAIPIDPPEARLGTGDLGLRQPISRRGPHGRPDGVPSRQGIRPPPPIEPPGGLPLMYPTTDDGVARAVNDVRSELTACFETAKFHSPDLASEMTLQLVIEPADGAPLGEVRSVHADLGESDEDDAMFETCLASVFGGLRFVAQTPITVRTPIDFDAPPGEVPARR